MNLLKNIYRLYIHMPTLPASKSAASKSASKSSNQETESVAGILNGFSDWLCDKYGSFKGMNINDVQRTRLAGVVLYNFRIIYEAIEKQYVIEKQDSLKTMLRLKMKGGMPILQIFGVIVIYALHRCIHSFMVWYNSPVGFEEIETVLNNQIPTPPNYLTNVNGVVPAGKMDYCYFPSPELNELICGGWPGYGVINKWFDPTYHDERFRQIALRAAHDLEDSARAKRITGNKTGNKRLKQDAVKNTIRALNIKCNNKVIPEADQHILCSRAKLGSQYDLAINEGMTTEEYDAFVNESADTYARYLRSQGFDERDLKLFAKAAAVFVEDDTGGKGKFIIDARDVNHYIIATPLVENGVVLYDDKKPGGRVSQVKKTSESWVSKLFNIFAKSSTVDQSADDHIKNMDEVVNRLGDTDMGGAPGIEFKVLHYILSKYYNNETTNAGTLAKEIDDIIKKGKNDNPIVDSKLDRRRMIGQIQKLMHPDHKSRIDDNLKALVSSYKDDVAAAFGPAIKGAEMSGITPLLINLKNIQTSGGRTRKSNTNKNKTKGGKSKKNKTSKNKSKKNKTKKN